MFKRFKSKERVSHDDEDADEDEKQDALPDVDDYLNTGKAKIIKTTVPSLRLDVIAKVGFGMSRTKLDKEFYKSNLRINGKKCLKKSVTVQIEDEIDCVLHRSPDNPNYLIVNRCTLLSFDAKVETETIYVKLLQNKSLLIEDYPDKWNGTN
ncbi:Mitochondrial transcription rescue factor 1 [Anthophora retusa]